jgi:type I restriction enzyme S subunit
MSSVVPDGWLKPKLDEVVTKFQNGYAFSAKGYVPEGIPIISMGSIQLDGIFKKNNKKIKFWNKEACDELSRYIVKSEDLIMAMTDVTPTMELIGRACIVKGDRQFFLNQRVGLISIDEDKAYKPFMAYLFNYDEWRSYCIGSSGLGAQANLGTAQILDGHVSLPPVPEQQKIATILTSVDEVIEKTQAKIDKLKDLKTGMMQELLSKGIGHTEFKDSPVGKIPIGWEVCTVNDVSKDVMVGVVIKPTQYYVESGVPALRSANVRIDGLTLDNLKYFSVESNDKLKKSKLQLGDLLTVRTGYPGTTAIVTKEFVGTNCIDVVITRPSNRIDSNFLGLWVNSDNGKGQVLKAQGGLAQQHFNVGDMKNLLVALPPLIEQLEIFNAVDSVTKKIKTLERKFEAYINTKKALMQDLLTGKVRVNTEQTNTEVAVG